MHDPRGAQALETLLAVPGLVEMAIEFASDLLAMPAATLSDGCPDRHRCKYVRSTRAVGEARFSFRRFSSITCVSEGDLVARLRLWRRDQFLLASAYPLTSPSSEPAPASQHSIMAANKHNQNVSFFPIQGALSRLYMLYNPKPLPHPQAETERVESQQSARGQTK